MENSSSSVPSGRTTKRENHSNSHSGSADNTKRRAAAAVGATSPKAAASADSNNLHQRLSSPTVKFLVSGVSYSPSSSRPTALPATANNSAVVSAKKNASSQTSFSNEKRRHPDETSMAAAAAVSNQRKRSASSTSPSAMQQQQTTPTQAAAVQQRASGSGSRGTRRPPPVTTMALPNNELVLLSPSQTITQTLQQLAKTTAQELESTWDWIGYSQHDRAAQISELLVQFRAVCQDKIAQEAGVAETYRQTIVEYRTEVQQWYGALKISAASRPATLQAVLEPANDDAAAQEQPPKRTNNNNMTLQDQLAILETELEGLRAEASKAKQELEQYRSVILEAHRALNDNQSPDDEVSPNGPQQQEKWWWMDIDSDLTLERRRAFGDKAKEMKTHVATRTEAVLTLVQDCQHLLQELDMDNGYESADGKSTTTTAVLEEGTNATLYSQENRTLDRRIMGSLEHSQKTDGSEQVEMASQFPTDSCVGIGARTVQDLTRRVAELHKEKRRRKKVLQEMGMEIAVLWEKLNISSQEQEAFTASVKGLGLDTLLKGQVELDRLHKLKAEMLHQLIDAARETIALLWDQINMPVEKRKAFAPYYAAGDAYKDELLQGFESYIAQLQQRAEQMKPIVRLIQRREKIVEERMEYEELQKDPDRLQQRGAAMTKQLMHEEKMARRIKRDLPRLDELVAQKLAEWKESNDGEDFVYYYNSNNVGEPYVDTMQRQEAEWNEYKEGEMQRKLQKKQQEKQALVETHRFGGNNKSKNQPQRPPNNIREGPHAFLRKKTPPLATTTTTTTRPVPVLPSDPSTNAAKENAATVHHNNRRPGPAVGDTSKMAATTTAGRSHSHEVTATSLAARPVTRGLGEKQASSRF